jgi:peptide/nickel transport system substrate-binding protein
MRSKARLWTASAGVLLLTAMLLSACGPSATTSGNPSGPKHGGTITDGLFEEPDSLLPEGSVETYADMVDATIWAPLFYGDNTGIIHAGLATDVPTPSNGGISSDLMTYKFTLRDGLKWSDGSPLTVNDVVFTLNLLKDPNFGGKSTFAGKEITSVSSSGNTVTIQLNKPDITFLELSLTDPLPFAPLPQKVFGSMAPADVLKSTQAFQPTVVSGPFTITERAKADHITLKANPNYYQSGKPYLAGMTFRIITSQDTILTALKSGEIQTSWFLDINKLTDYKAISGYSVVLDKSPGSFEGIYFNETNPILADAVVRKAISQSIKVDDIITKIWQGIAVKDCDDGTGTFAHDTSATCYTYDPTSAAAALTADGWTMGSDSYRHKGGKTLELRYSTTAGKAYREQTQLIVQAALKTNIGMKIDIVNKPADAFFGTQLYDYSAYDIAEFANSLTYDPDNHVQWACNQFTDQPGGFNISHYCNPDVDANIKTEQTNADIATRTTAFHKIYQDIINDLPAMYYYAYPNIAVKVNNLQNYAPSPVGPSETWNVWDWYLS